MDKSNNFCFRVEYHDVPALIDNLLLFLVRFRFGYNDIMLVFFLLKEEDYRRRKESKPRGRLLKVYYFILSMLCTLCFIMRSCVHPFKALLTSSWKTLIAAFVIWRNENIFPPYFGLQFLLRPARFFLPHR